MSQSQDWNANVLIEIQTPISRTVNYGQIPIDSRHPLNSEPLVDIRDGNVEGNPYYHIEDGSNPPYCSRIEGSIPRILVRRSVLDLLCKVNTLLKPLDCELFVWDGYRPIATQRGLWDFFTKKFRRERNLPETVSVYDEVIKYVSDPTRFDKNDSSTWPTHTTGAAIDLTLRNVSNGKLLDMGASFDQMDDFSHSDYFERLFVLGHCDEAHPPLKNRRLLHSAMKHVGFRNYPLEYWHFDWGNQMYADSETNFTAENIPIAWYGYIDPMPSLI